VALWSLKKVADELGFKSVQSVRNLSARGELTIVHLPVVAGAKRKVGPSRIDSEQVLRLRARALAGRMEHSAVVPLAPAPPRRRRTTPRQRAAVHFE
jgi:hypothetical protein